MRHAVQIRQTGGPEVLNWTAVDIGEPGSGQVRQAAAGINYIDVYRRTGYLQPLHFISGLEGAGTVEAVAQDARCLKIGDRAAYAGPTGGYLPVALDSVGKDSVLRSLDCLRPRGLMVTFGQASGPIDSIALVLLSQKGSLFLTRPILFHYIERRDHLAQCP